MSDDTSLQRAHDLSARASVMLGPGQLAPSTLDAALGAYKEAAELFDAAALEVGGDASAKRTLQLLATQHRKLAKDLERRISSIASGSGGSSVTKTTASVRQEVHRRSTEPVQARDALGLGAISRQVWPPPGVATRISTPRGLPPFALRPTIPEGTTIDGLLPPPQAASSSSQNHAEYLVSPMHSSSSSSGTEGAESYINFGAIPDTLDPFSRFWGKLDNMLDDISNPVAFATASMDQNLASDPTAGTAQDKETRKGKEKAERRKEKSKDSTSESFYLVNKQNVPYGASGDTRTSSPSEKTPEELALENENLRASLDAIASHAQAVDDENKRLKAEADARNTMMKSAILEVRREAQKAKHGQDLMRSQLMGSIPSPNPRTASRLEASRYPTLPSNHDLITNQKKRIESLEEELRISKLENEQNRDAAAKYKERLDRIKANAKSKKEAKAREEQDGSSRN